MPLYKTIAVNANTTIWIWKIEESYEELLRGIIPTEKCLQRVGSMKSDIHRRGFLSVRQLLKIAGYEAEALFYDANGKPHLRDGKHISISHSFQFSAIIVSDFPVGIDVEKQREKITIIADKFVDYEFSYLNESELVRKLTVIWCAKESMYKVFAAPGMSFKEHTRVIPFDLGENETTAWIHFKGEVRKYRIPFLEFEGFSCAYAIQKCEV
ncbi:4'-phosphopantetheinyl transferase family protein [Sinomicrobium weinanense]|uniref:4'-phosphopantetheinyl transferase superfamily protein n=1 Tax=Sinomicrobium weinanense TaxID=2842200 RepID=A0A926JQ37_9FLAO|nr:4'-phosphopantetheinyl transferase family protein [Sinomicrobium weinanense]MBC9795407.1 4'-phosphopantetheinyl transferase superfamily protein [Sinomicrobium weinanense]MBU3123932.1 4'-phosphopantetheinyl transferase superfamily protein [Sinomicrobium weinanense]